MREGGFSLIKPTTRHWNTVITVMSVLIVAETITFLLATLLHLGIPVPLGFTQPQIIPAAIVEGLCGVFLAVSAYAIFTYKTWAWRVALAAHIFAVAGVLLGILATIRSSAGGEPNFIYHRVILGALIVVLVLLATPPARAALGCSHRVIQKG